LREDKIMAMNLLEEMKEEVLVSGGREDHEDIKRFEEGIKNI
jgi:phosphoribosylformimino-5-aminoimidazole carboxamide ribonucleotide (ProFAR) isomerase